MTTKGPSGFLPDTYIAKGVIAFADVSRVQQLGKSVMRA